tara:strand:+ start:540 stop:758 length:219 start_codon:yes stop_codon:yes gene_type:complete
MPVGFVAEPNARVMVLGVRNPKIIVHKAEDSFKSLFSLFSGHRTTRVYPKLRRRKITVDLFRNHLENRRSHV